MALVGLESTVAVFFPGSVNKCKGCVTWQLLSVSGDWISWYHEDFTCQPFLEKVLYNSKDTFGFLFITQFL